MAETPAQLCSDPSRPFAQARKCSRHDEHSSADLECLAPWQQLEAQKLLAAPQAAAQPRHTSVRWPRPFLVLPSAPQVSAAARQPSHQYTRLLSAIERVGWVTSFSAVGRMGAARTSSAAIRSLPTCPSLRAHRRQPTAPNRLVCSCAHSQCVAGAAAALKLPVTPPDGSP